MMVWCATNSAGLGGDGFTADVHDELQRVSSCDYVIITPNKYLEFIALAEDGQSEAETPESFDSVVAAEIFSFFFVSTLGLWFLAKNIGVILQAIRRF